VTDAGNNSAAEAPPARRVRSITYEHDGDRYEVTVGAARKVYRRKTGPRGGYIKNAANQGWGTPTGAVVTRIESGEPYLVWTEEPSGGWANPSYVGRQEIKSIAYFDAVPTEVGTPNTNN
jgi:hypothetical protein